MGLNDKVDEGSSQVPYNSMIYDLPEENTIAISIERLENYYTSLSELISESQMNLLVTRLPINKVALNPPS